MGSRPKTGGRKKGTPNKVSGAVKDNVVAVFDEIGGHATMASWARENLTEYYRLYARMAPIQQEVTGANGGPVQNDLSIKVCFGK